MTIKERVRNGATWLDAQKKDWRRLVSLETLDMPSPWGCILGQTETWIAAEHAVADNPQKSEIAWLVDHGFLTRKDSEYPGLKRAWTQELRGEA